MSKKDLAYYRALPFTRRVTREQGDEGEGYYFVAEIVELPGCFAVAESRLEAIAKLNEVFDEYVEAKLEWRSEIPEPQHRVTKRERAEGWETRRVVRHEATGPDLVYKVPQPHGETVS